jgi:hypothetical protein
MPAIVILGGLVLLLLALKSGGSGSGAVTGRNGGGGSMPDPGAAPTAGMVGAAAHLVPYSNAITPFSGTAKLAPDQALNRLNGAGRVALRGVGTPQIPVRVPPPPSVRTTNPATTPFSAVSSNAINGQQAFGRAVQNAITVNAISGTKI